MPSTIAPILLALALLAPTIRAADTWDDVATRPDPVTPIIDAHRQQIATLPPPQPTGLSRQHYLETIELITDHFQPEQQSTGRLRGAGPTACLAQTAALTAIHRNRPDLLEPAALALDWVVTDLAYGSHDHSDFAATRAVNALELLEPHVDPARAQYWRTALASYDPYQTYFYTLGGSNWNMIALAGEWKLYQLGLRTNPNYVNDSVDANGYRLSTPWGLYEDPSSPMAYDLFARAWVSDVVVGWEYSGSHADDLAEVLRRGALTSLLIQSPNGQFPAGGRRSPYHWPDGAQCIIFEIYASQAADHGDLVLAGIYKRAARLALRQVRQWIQPGHLDIITKNHWPASQSFGLESGTGSGYNLTLASFLVIASQYAAHTEHLPEQYAPCEIGGFAFKIDDNFHKVFANAAGMYLEIDTRADHNFDPTGLIRINKLGRDHELGPSNGCVSNPNYHVPSGYPTADLAVGPAWQDPAGNWHALAKYVGSISSVALENLSAQPDRVAFSLLYTGPFDGNVSQVRETYTITPDNIHVTSRPLDYSGPVRFLWPILADDGRDLANVALASPYCTWTLGPHSQCYRAVNPTGMWVEDDLYPNRYGLCRRGVAQFDDQAEMILAFDLDGDFNYDSRVDTFDLARLLDAWLLPDPALDLAPDGIVNLRDYAAFVANYAGPDTTGPTPAVMTWAVLPAPVSPSAIEMTAATATDDSGVEYRFYNLTDPAHDSPWLSDPHWRDTKLQSETTYSYQVVARDRSPLLNRNQPSAPAAATTPAFEHLTFFETFDTDPTARGWTSDPAGDTTFTYDPAGFLDASIYKQQAHPARYYTPLPGYDRTTQCWYEFDCRFLDLSGDWGNALLGIFADTAGDYEFLGARFATKKTTGHRYDLWYQSPSAQFDYWLGPNTLADNADVRIRCHYWYDAGQAYATMEVIDLASGHSIGTLGPVPILPQSSSFIYRIFALANRTDGDSAGLTRVLIDNLYFSTQSPNQTPTPPSFP